MSSVSAGVLRPGADDAVSPRTDSVLIRSLAAASKSSCSGHNTIAQSLISLYVFIISMTKIT